MEEQSFLRTSNIDLSYFDEEEDSQEVGEEAERSWALSEESGGESQLTCQARPDAHHLVEDLRGGHGGLHEDWEEVRRHTSSGLLLCQISL